MKLILTIACLALASCVSTITTTTSPDGTVTVVEQRGIDQASVVAAADTVAVAGSYLIATKIA